ncbi:hypothetical protein KY366_07545 [Candidatus Woesearchaeota archaeon]|nr:hypothetical protein [Candidatus Woesearchaeota archaeon]
MRFILDANPLFSALIKDSFTANVIVNEDIELSAPEFLFDEFLEHREEILAKTKRTERELDGLVDNLKDIIHIVPQREFEPFLEEAKQLTSDEDDVTYLALALKLRIPIWSNDKKFKKQDKVKVYSTGQIKEMLEKQRNILQGLD